MKEVMDVNVVLMTLDELSGMLHHYYSPGYMLHS